MSISAARLDELLAIALVEELGTERVLIATRRANELLKAQYPKKRNQYNRLEGYVKIHADKFKGGKS